MAAARALAEVMHRRDLVGRVEVLSFHDEAVAEIARLVPGVRTALVASRYGTDVVDRAVGGGRRHARAEHPPADPGGRRAGARKADLRIIGWVVNTQDHLRLVRGAAAGRRDHRLPGDQTHRPLHGVGLGR